MIPYRQCELVTLAYTLWSICCQSEKYILIFCNDKEQARASLQMIKKALESHALRKEDFPEATRKHVGHGLNGHLSCLFRLPLKLH